jgi:hypothetical protein
VSLPMNLARKGYLLSPAFLHKRVEERGKT